MATTMNLTDFAAWQGISYRTALRWRKEGTLPYPSEQVGRQIFVTVPNEDHPQQQTYPHRTVVYISNPRARASDVLEWALEHGIQVDETHREQPSDGTLPALKRLLADPAITRIVTDFHPQSDLLSAALSAHGREFITTTTNRQSRTRTFQPRIASSAGA
ncbi:hypothetical protein [Gordonia sihwensis]|uniref:hypothetical protein n=1 Tax=Gordonia sihwensis TaxID=173559 RepID=UPI003D9827B3